MSTRSIQLEKEDRAEFQHLQDFLNRMFQKYGSDVWAATYSKLTTEALMHASDPPRELRCSFCGKRPSEVADRIVNGANVSICIGCIDLCYKVRSEQWPDHP